MEHGPVIGTPDVKLRTGMSITLDVGSLRSRVAAACDALLPPPGATLLVAVSGGADSCALWDLLALDGRWPLAVYHLDHGLRADSAADAELVRARAEIYGGTPVMIERTDVRALAALWRCGLEAAGRRHRYTRLAAIARDLDIAVVLTAHHAGDQAETVLHNLLRGADAVGCAGIAARREMEGGVPLLRPLLAFASHELRAHLVSRGLAWREDATNADVRFTRNRLRHRLLPALEEMSPGIARELALFAAAHRHRLVDADARLDALERDAVDGLAVRLVALDGVDADLAGLFWRRLLRRLGLPLERRHIDALARLAEARPGTRFALGRLLFLRRGDRIAWEEADPHGSDAVITVGGEGSFQRGEQFLTVRRASVPADARTPPGEVWLDAAKVALPLIWRLPSSGERFQPLGNAGRQTIAKFLAERGVPSRSRALTPVLADRDGVVWVPGFGVAERAKVDATTRDTLHLSCIAAVIPSG